jgi:hypothetical protein
MPKSFKEPWRYEEDKYRLASVLTKDDVVVFTDYDAMAPEWVELLKRIVACVNACAGMEDPEREMAQIRQPSAKPTNSHFQAWELTRRIGLQPVRWSVILPNGDSLDGLTTEAAAISARAHLRPMWAALVEPPTDLYEAFHTDGKAWGFFDREGNLHAQFPSRADAAGCAARREDADYSTPATA